MYHLFNETYSLLWVQSFNKIKLKMRLPKIQENENPLKNDYFSAIVAKPVNKKKS